MPLTLNKSSRVVRKGFMWKSSGDITEECSGGSVLYFLLKVSLCWLQEEYFPNRFIIELILMFHIQGTISDLCSSPSRPLLPGASHLKPVQAVLTFHLLIFLTCFCPHAPADLWQITALPIHFLALFSVMCWDWKHKLNEVEKEVCDCVCESVFSVCSLDCVNRGFLSVTSPPPSWPDFKSVFKVRGKHKADFLCTASALIVLLCG